MGILVSDTHSLFHPPWVGKGMGMGNTMCFHLGVCWGMGTVLTFYTRKHTIPSAEGTGVLLLYPTVWRTGILTRIVSWAPQMTQVQP